MAVRKTFQWAATFFVLSLFTVQTFNSVTNRTELKAYAQTIASTPDLSARSAFVVTNPAEVRRTILRRVIDRLIGRADRERELCGLTEDQHQALAQKYPTETETIHVGDSTVSLVKIKTGDLTKSQIASLMREAGAGNPHCTILEVYEQIIFLLTAHLS